MLNIPDAIKTLYQQDSVRKNFRVIFPNGELPDITNANVLTESVRFTESLCSQQYLRFGLTEASEIQFETIGIPNMMGMTIKCYSEIDTSSLTAAQISEIQAMSDLDGELVLAANSDLTDYYGNPWGFYRVPYGTFTVDSCPRNHGAMTHRKVTAYSTTISNVTAENSLEKYLEDNTIVTKGTSYGVNALGTSLAYVYANYPDGLIDFGWTKNADSDVFASTRTFSVSYYDSNSTRINLLVTLLRNTRHSTTYPSDNVLMYFEKGAYSFQDVLNAFNTYFESIGVDPVTSGYSDWDDLMSAFGASLRYYGGVPTFMVSNDATRLYRTQKDEVWLNEREWWGYFPAKYSVTRGSSTEDVYTVSNADLDKLYYYTPPNSIPFPQISIKVEPSGEATINGVRYDTFVDAIKTEDFVNGFVELNGYFAKSRRQGGYDFLRISDAAPVSIGRSLYTDLWWDEYDVDPIGAIEYTYRNKDTEKDETVTYGFGEGDSVYEMKDNFILKNISNATMSTINSLLDTYFIPNIGSVNFTPIDLDMVGLPYLEDGDYLTITAEDGVEVSSYILRHSIDGIQALTDKIESTNGELMTSEEVET